MGDQWHPTLFQEQHLRAFKHYAWPKCSLRPWQISWSVTAAASSLHWASLSSATNRSRPSSQSPSGSLKVRCNMSHCWLLCVCVHMCVCICVCFMLSFFVVVDFVLGMVLFFFFCLSYLGSEIFFFFFFFGGGGEILNVLLYYKAQYCTLILFLTWMSESCNAWRSLLLSRHKFLCCYPTTVQKCC